MKNKKSYFYVVVSLMALSIILLKIDATRLLYIEQKKLNHQLERDQQNYKDLLYQVQTQSIDLNYPEPKEEIIASAGLEQYENFSLKKKGEYPIKKGVILIYHLDLFSSYENIQRLIINLKSLKGVFIHQFSIKSADHLQTKPLIHLTLSFNYFVKNKNHV